LLQVFTKLDSSIRVAPGKEIYVLEMFQREERDTPGPDGVRRWGIMQASLIFKIARIALFQIVALIKTSSKERFFGSETGDGPCFAK
jgi:hypothetical protein